LLTDPYGSVVDPFDPSPIPPYLPGYTDFHTTMPYTIEQTDAQLKKTSAAIRYHVSFERAAQHLADVRIEIDTDEDKLTLALPNWIPGSYKVRDFISFLNDFGVATTKGAALPFEWIAKNRVRIATRGSKTVVVTYTYFGNERSVRQSHINRFHAFLNPATCMMYVEGRTDEIHHVTLDHGWKEVSTALSPVNRKGTYGALNYDILADSPLEIGDHYVGRFTAHGAEHEIAITGSGDVDHEWLVEQVKVIVDTAVATWEKLPYDRYVFIIQLIPGIITGLEHARSSVNVFDAFSFGDKERSLRLLALLCHEYFHVWNVKRIRPIELGPFDYNTENYTRMLWLAEGLTSYYDDLMVYRCGFSTRDEYLKALATDHLGRLADTPGRLAMSLKDSSYLSWVKLYVPTPDAENRFPSYYLKGGVVFLLLDMHIIAESGGDSSLDDALRALMERYWRDPSTGLTEEEFITIVTEATGVDIREPFLQWLGSTDELPIADVVARLGLAWREKAPAKTVKFGEDRAFIAHDTERWLGVSLEEVKTGLKVARVLRDSPAEAAGLGADDEVLAVNGRRVASRGDFDAMVRGTRSGRIEVLGASEGQLYTAKIKPGRKRQYELVVREDITEEQQRLLEVWLAR
jgi:predicted metalloprotease with PDZ domain